MFASATGAVQLYCNGIDLVKAAAAMEEENFHDFRL